MARKTAGTLEEQRNRIKSQYRRGPRSVKSIVSLENFSEAEILVKREAACWLKASDYSYSYIADALHISKEVVKEWFGEPEMQERVATVLADVVSGALMLLRGYTIELVEMLVDIARTSDDKTALNAITEALDRLGMAKVNKSESVVSNLNKQQVEITDSTGLLESLRDAPPEVQQAAARKLQELQDLAAEFTEGDAVESEVLANA